MSIKYAYKWNFIVEMQNMPDTNMVLHYALGLLNFRMVRMIQICKLYTIHHTLPCSTIFSPTHPKRERERERQSEKIKVSSIGYSGRSWWSILCSIWGFIIIPSWFRSFENHKSTMQYAFPFRWYIRVVYLALLLSWSSLLFEYRLCFVVHRIWINVQSDQRFQFNESLVTYSQIWFWWFYQSVFQSMHARCTQITHIRS